MEKKPKAWRGKQAEVKRNQLANAVERYILSGSAMLKRYGLSLRSFLSRYWASNRLRIKVSLSRLSLRISLLRLDFAGRVGKAGRYQLCS